MNRVVVFSFLTGAFLLVGFVNRGMSQQDSLWHGEVAISFSSQSDLRPGNKFALNNYSFKVNNHKSTIVGSLIQLKQREEVGLQYDVSYYSNMKEGYSLLKASCSHSSRFPSWTGEAKYWHNIAKPLTLGVGARHISYDGGTKVNLFSTDLTYYIKNWMINYAYTMQLAGAGFQIFKIRKYGKHPSNYFEVSGGNSAQIAKGLDWQLNQVHSQFLQFGIQQTITDNIKIKGSTFYSRLSSELKDQSFIDFQFSLSKSF